MEYPENFARFYDVIYHQVRDGVDNQYFQNQIQQADGKVLEIGVGTGRLFMQAINHGANIYGIDISSSMIDVLNKKLTKAQQKRISLQNIVDFNFDFKFDLVIAPFRVFMHLLEKDKQIQALNNVFKHLNSGGKFIFDVFVPDLKQLLEGLHNKTDFEGEYEPGKEIKRVVSTKPDLINQIIDISFHLEWEENDMIKHEDWQLQLRFFFRFEMEHLVERSLFEKYKLLGDYQGNALSQDSKELIVVCQK